MDRLKIICVNIYAIWTQLQETYNRRKEANFAKTKITLRLKEGWLKKRIPEGGKNTASGSKLCDEETKPKEIDLCIKHT